MTAVRLMSRMLCIAVFLGLAPSAMALSLSERAGLQAAMSRHIEERTVDGVYLYLDGKSGDVRGLHPVTAHPMILRMGPRYVLCYDFRDTNGKDVPVDFYMAQKGDSYVVFSTAIQNRSLLQRLMGAGKVTRAE